MTGELDDRMGSGPVEFAKDLWTRRKGVALLAFAAVFAALVSLTVSLPDLYRATTTVLVESQQISEALVQPSVTSELGIRLQRIRQEVMSRARLGELIRQLNLYAEFRNKGVPFDTVIDEMRRHIDLELTGVDQMSARGATIAFAISYSGRDPETVAKVANVLASLYVEENTKIRAGQAARTAQVLRAQLDEVKNELDMQERRTSDYTLRHLGELPQQVEANLGSLDRLNTQLRLNSENQIRALDRRDRLEKQLAELPAVTSSGPVAAAPRATQLATLKQQLQDLRKQFRDSHPDVIRLQAEIATAEQLAEEEREAAAAAPVATASTDPKERLTQAIAEVGAELKSLKVEELGLRQSIATYETRVENLPKRQEEFQLLSRDYQSTKERHDALLKRYEDAQLAASLEQGKQVEQFRVLDPALPPRYPAAPSRPKLLLAGLFLSLVFAAGAVMAAEKLDTSFHSIDDLRSFVRGPALFSVPVIQTIADTRRRWRRRALVTAAVVVALSLIVAGVGYVASGNERIVRLVARGHV